MPFFDVFCMLNCKANNLDAGSTDEVRARAWNYIAGVKTFELH
jgi:hypothetical protein